ncbi:lactose 3-dehydrogenase subunit gamma LacC [Rhabdobacter roseus]|uniref:Gluconate 2-dehydrogenase subunit 3 family protein n=1 Tax=Rhabdobacter roseus TaxID=1655419 RepID=A0A840TWJ5_9BACT|nr:gluconate 2-dehydrogenase subunit 3 family protein [Rhabdobacter roseus]MBB5284568.1 hypothetical protein [Rhabdobacter roseus]
MQRRVALKNMALGLGGMISLPAWANAWTSTNLPQPTLLTSQEGTLLASVVDTILPATDTPGAQELGVDRFIQTMLTDCYEKQAQDNLTKGLAMVQTISQSTFGKDFAAGTPAQRIHVLEGMGISDDPTQKGFYSMVKGLTIQGYMSSEYVMKNLTKYEMIPGRFHGCVPVKA